MGTVTSDQGPEKWYVQNECETSKHNLVLMLCWGGACIYIVDFNDGLRMETSPESTWMYIA